MKGKTLKRIYWGLVFVAAAVFIILKMMGVNLGFVATLPVTDVVLAVLVLSVAVVSAVKLNLWAIPFELAVVFMLFENEIAAATGLGSDGNIINNWLLLLCALLLSIGISLLFRPFIRLNPFRDKFGNKLNDKHAHHLHEHTFGSTEKYIDCAVFENEYYMSRLGECDIYFQNIDSYKGNGRLCVDNRMGEMTIHVPSAWNVVIEIDSSMGELNLPKTNNPDGLLLTVTGTNRMGEMSIVSDN